MKKTLFAALAAAAMMISCLSGCAASEVTSTDSGWQINDAGIALSYPEGWAVYSGAELYEQVFSADTGGFESPEDMKELMELDGLKYLLYGCDETTGSAVTVSVQDMTAGEEDPTAEEYARSVHDTTVITYQANGFKIRDGSFTQETYGGVAGYLSHFELLTYEDESFILGQSEFMFAQGDDMYAIQVFYSTEDSRDEALAVLTGMKGKLFEG